VNEKPRAIVVPVGEDLEVTLASLRWARAFNALETIRISAHKWELETLTEQEIDQEIRQARTGR
jgi:hypothetical protein